MILHDDSKNAILNDKVYVEAIIIITAHQVSTFISIERIKIIACASNI